jgi:hypothetical protein
VYKLNASEGVLPSLGNVFSEKFKEINKSDKDFCYTCVCDGYNTQWRFAYSSSETRLAARAAIREMLELNKGKNHLVYGSDLFDTEPSNWDGCACPFNSK